MREFLNLKAGGEFKINSWSLDLRCILQVLAVLRRKTLIIHQIDENDILINTCSGGS